MNKTIMKVLILIFVLSLLVACVAPPVPTLLYAERTCPPWGNGYILMPDPASPPIPAPVQVAAPNKPAWTLTTALSWILDRLRLSDIHREPNYGQSLRQHTRRQRK
jgi:hypothetical protein